MIALTHNLGWLPLVLAKGEVVGAAFFVIWVIVSLVSAAQKKKQQQQKQAPQLPLPQDWLPPQKQTAPPRKQAASQRLAAPPRLPARINPAKPSPLPPKKLPAAKATPQKLPVLAAPAVEEPVWQPMKDMVQSQWAKTTTRSSQMQVMLRPSTVRQGIVLAEILRPPLALREEESAW